MRQLLYSQRNSISFDRNIYESVHYEDGINAFMVANIYSLNINETQKKKRPELLSCAVTLVLHYYALWLQKILRHFHKQSSESHFKTNRDHDLLARVFPRLARLHVFASSSDWFIRLSAPVVIGQSDYFDFDFTPLKQQQQRLFVLQTYKDVYIKYKLKIVTVAGYPK